MNQKIKIALAAGLAVVLIGLISVLSDVGGIGKDKDLVVEIPEGAGTAGISRILKENKVISYSGAFRLYAKIGKAPLWQKGKHIVNTSMSYRQILQKLQAMPDIAPDTCRVVIPEGYELRQIVDLLVENGLGKRETFWQEIEQGDFDYPFIAQIPERENRLEGYLYPDTYMFSVEESEHQIIDKMLDAFSQKIVPLYEESGSGESLDSILIMASVIEREAANDEERPQVASVFYNRLRIGMKLESCATVQYILKERKEILSNQDTAIDSPYNTYKYEGLPIGPIAAPGQASVQAALYPANTEYLYFVATADGSKNLFSKTFEEHNQKTVEIQS